LINSGIVGLVVYLSTIGWGLRQSIKNRDVLLFGFIVLLVFVSLSENLLDVNKGIFFYAFFFPLLVLSGKKHGTQTEKGRFATPQSDPRIILKKPLQEI
jgi:hypothetical protein